MGMKVTNHSDNIWTIDDFLSVTACEDLILFSEQKGFEEATVGLKSGAKMMKGIRNNFRLMYKDVHLANQYWKILKPYCPSDIDDKQVIGLNELFRFYKYESMQRFKRHIDGRFRRNEEESRITFMIYLNTDYIGGETRFDDLTIQPKTGMALCFFHEQKHEGMPVLKGTKYVIRTDVMYKMHG